MEGEDFSAAGMRIENIRIAMEGFMERPVFGWGVGSWYSYRQSRTGMLGYTLSTHSGWALMLFETGLAGTILYAALIFACLRGLELKFTGSLAGDIGFIAFLGVASVLIVSLGGDTLLKRGTFTYMSLGAYARCAALRRTIWERGKA